MAAAKGSEITQSVLEKKFGELTLSLEELINGEDIEYIINNILPKKLIDNIAEQQASGQEKYSSGMEMERDAINSKRWENSKLETDEHNLMQVYLPLPHRSKESLQIFAFFWKQDGRPLSIRGPN